MSKRMNWEAANSRGRLKASKQLGRLVEIPANTQFWKAWHADKAAMTADGYFVRKTPTDWKAFHRE